MQAFTADVPHGTNPFMLVHGCCNVHRAYIGMQEYIHRAVSCTTRQLLQAGFSKQEIRKYAIA